MQLREHKTILVVDDEPAILIAISKRLSHAGYDVLTACDGEEAIGCATTQRVDAITLDVAMPGLIDGLGVAKALSGRIPIIFVTGSAGPDFRQKCEAAGGRYFLSKPYDTELLLRILDSILAEDELAEVERISHAKRRQPVM